MPRWRKLHVKTRQSLDINEMPDDFTRLLWVLMPLGLDREGRGLDNVSWVKAQLMPLRTDVTLDAVSGALEWYEKKGMIVRYAVNGRGYFHAPTFSHYQGDTSREAESEFPAPPSIDESEGTQEPVTRESRPTQESVTTHSSTDSDVYSDSDSEVDAEANAGSPFQEAVTIWEDMTGRITDRTRQQFAMAADEYGEERLLYAVKEAHDHNAKKWAYVEAVLENRGRSPPGKISIEDQWLAEQTDGE